MTTADLVEAMNKAHAERARKRNEKIADMALMAALAYLFLMFVNWVRGVCTGVAMNNREERFAEAARVCGRHLAEIDGGYKVAVPGRRHEAAATAFRAALRARGIDDLHAVEQDWSGVTTFTLRHSHGMPHLQRAIDESTNRQLEADRIWREHEARMAQMDRVQEERLNRRSTTRYA